MECINLEPVCAKWGMDVVMCSRETKNSDKVSVINKALGVLAENGFYAMYVFLLSCSKKEQRVYGEQVYDILLHMLRSDGIALLRDSGKEEGAQALDAVRKVTENLPALIFARRLTEQTLTFARYHCKALSATQD